MSPVAAGTSFITAVILLPLLIRWAKSRDLLDVPNARSSHVVPTPRIGGVAIVTAVAVAFLTTAHSSTFAVLAFGALTIAASGLADDMRPQPARLRLLVQVGVATAMVAILGPFDLSMLGLPRPVAAVLTVLWITGFVNAYNFMDGIDGIAGVQSLAAAAGWMWIGAHAGSREIISAASAVAGGSAGFLLFNRPPARVFMGDAGSAFLGFLFAVLPWGLADHHLAGSVAAGILLWPFLFDSAFTLSRRLYLRQNVWEAHRSHLYQRLVSSGFSHLRVTSLYAVLALTGIPVAVAAARGPAVTAAVGMAVLALLAGALWLFVIHVEHQKYRATITARQ